MPEYAYTTVTGKIKPLLEKVRTTGVPAKVTVAWLKQIGFTSSNDATLAGVLRYIGFVDTSGIPTPVWAAYRGANHKAILADAIRKGYADLFAVYPDAHTRSNADLTNVFNTSSSAGAQVINKTVQTFKALVDEADFNTQSSGAQTVMISGPLHTPAAASSQPPTPPQSQANPEVHIDIQIHISPESTGEQIDQIFKSMAKHLYGRKDS